MAMLGAIASIASAGLGAMGAMQQGAAAQAAGQYQQDADIAQGKADFAAAQRDMIQKQQQTDVTQSRQIALAAASGAGVQTPTIKDIYGQTAGRGDYMARTALYPGQQRQWALNVAGANAKYQGDVAEQAATLNAIGAGIGGLSKVNWGSFGNFSFG